MDFLEVPKEVLESIFKYLPPVSLLSCSEAAPQFAQLINRDVFLDRYCQILLQADWIKWDMILTARKSFPLILEMWYLSAVTACHPNLTLNACDSLHSVGIFIYSIDMWLINQRTKTVDRSHCMECLGFQVILSAIANKHARHLLMKLFIAVPELMEFTCSDVEGFLCSEGNPWKLDILSPFYATENDAIESLYLEDFDIKYCLEMILAFPTGTFSFSVPAVCILVGEESWIGWTGSVERMSFRYQETTACMKTPCNTMFDETLSVLKNIFRAFLDKAKENTCAQHGWGTLSVLTKEIHSTKERLWDKFIPRLEELACQLSKKTAHIELNKDSKNKLIRYLDTLLAQRPRYSDTDKRSSTIYVSVLRYLHRGLNNIFYIACMRYLENTQCLEFLLLSRQAKRGIPRLRPTERGCEAHLTMEQFYEQVSVHNLPPRLWPNHLLRHAMTAAPVVSRLVQLDILLWTKSLHCQPVSDKIRQFLVDQTDSCELTSDMSQIIYPPLCGRVKYRENNQTTQKDTNSKSEVIYRRLETS